MQNTEVSKWKSILGNTSMGKETFGREVPEQIVEIDLSKDELFKYMIELGGHIRIRDK